MKMLWEVTPEKWLELLEQVERALGLEARRLIEHKISTLELMLALEQDEDGDNYLED
jgi:hypothetical protein